MQIEQDLCRQIASGTLVAGTRLPRAIELAERYGASSETLRRALKGRAGAVFIQRTHGVGTIVTRQPSPVMCDLDPVVMERVLAHFGADCSGRFFFGGGFGIDRHLPITCTCTVRFLGPSNSQKYTFCE
jgi:DNA-binding transcriptional regulator YhcF (GntR family)